MKSPQILDLTLEAGRRRSLWGSHRLRTAVGCPLLTARTRYGQCMRLDPTKYVDGFVLRHGCYEGEVCEVVLDHLRLGDVFWDVGVNIGLYAVAVAPARSEVRAIAFEPLSIRCGRVAQNAVLKNVAVTLVSAAPSDHGGVGCLQFQTGNLGKPILRDRGAQKPGREVCCTITGDVCVASGLVPTPAVLKFDEERHEAAVLAKLADLLARDAVRVVVFEAAPDAADNPDDSVGGPLRRAGFALSVLSRNEPTAHNVKMSLLSATELHDYAACKGES